MVTPRRAANTLRMARFLMRRKDPDRGSPAEGGEPETMHLARRLLMTLALATMAGPSFASGPLSTYYSGCLSVSMTVTASPSNDPGFEGLWKYTLSGSWDVGQRALSHMDILLMLGDCPNLCDPGLVVFGSPAGLSTGEDSLGVACALEYTGSYLCEGDPSIPPNLREPAAKFEPVNGEGCSSMTEGSGTWIFYSVLPPGEDVLHEDVIVIKHGNQACTGDVSGRLPICVPPTAVEVETWGRVKAIFR